ncbi:MAG: hypothetical protein IK093_04230 [Ruminiclostridium sp.]|nr:hypothetical protein [Ruminiclostridium sp.]
MGLFGKKKSSAPETGAEEVQLPVKNGNSAPFKLELLITIVEKNKAEFYADLIQAYEVNFQFAAPAHGTAKADILDYLGLADTDKTVIFSVVREDRLDDIVYMLERKFSTIRGGKGVAVSVPFTSMIGTSVYAFLGNAVSTVKGDEGLGR